MPDMDNPLALWRAGVRWPLALIGLAAALLVAVVICEAAGWPFLVGPVQRELANALDRKVEFGDAPSTSSGVRIGLIGSLRVRADSIEIGAPSWSPAPHMLLAKNVRLKLGYLDLWRAWRGGPLHVAVLEASDLDGVLQRSADGRASWHFGTKKTTDQGGKPTALPTFGTLRVGDGHVLYVDEILPAGIDARFALSDGSRDTPAAIGAASASDADAAASAAAASAPSTGASGTGIFIRAGGAAGAS